MSTAKTCPGPSAPHRRRLQLVVAVSMAMLAGACSSGQHRGAVRGPATTVEHCTHPIPRGDLVVDPPNYNLDGALAVVDTHTHGPKPDLCIVDIATLRVTPIPHTTVAVEGVWLTDGVAYLLAIRENPRNFPIMIEHRGSVTQLQVKAFTRGVYDVD